ncbi:GntR family transcriptional regulator [Aeromicrobium sp.]|uniref:GntR family transcriptional regulator n=1 Tax=Aeromicrobium sp. TaxID=1871063 RepID=UPI0025BEBA93|nr:GntR family transcriptional regulator [Aeromicrobium sp.]
MLANGPLPKHARLREVLLATISEELEPGDMIPSERDLTIRYGVSRATVRAAISALVNDGRLTTVPGRGTVVTRPRVESNLHLASFTQDMRRRGHRPSTELIGCSLGDADDSIANALDLGVGDGVWIIERLRLADAEPMAHEVSWYPADLFPDLDAEDLTTSLYAIFESRYGVVIAHADQTVWTEPAGEHARLLEVAAESPVLVFDRISRTAGRPAERAVSRYRGDRYQITMSLNRSSTHSTAPLSRDRST